MKPKSDKPSFQTPVSSVLRNKLDAILGSVYLINGDDVEQCQRLENEIIDFIKPQEIQEHLWTRDLGGVARQPSPAQLEDALQKLRRAAEIVIQCEMVSHARRANLWRFSNSGV